MKHLLHYIKPFVCSILMVIVLLFVQAQCELALPDYMADIVDTGIQKGGVKDAVPSIIRQSEMEHMMLFMSDDDVEVIKEHYTLLDHETASVKQIEEYPLLVTENLYELQTIDEDMRTSLNSILVKPELLVAGIRKQMADESSELYQRIPQGMDVFDVLRMMQKDQINEIKQAIDEQMSDLNDTTLTAAGASFVKSEYEVIGLDGDAIQNSYIIKSGGKMLLVALISAICAVLVGLFASRVGAGFARDVRQDVFEKVERFSNEEFNKFSTSSLITRTTNDVQQIQMVLIMMLRVVIYAPIIGIGAIIHVLNSKATMTWIIALCVVILLSLIGVLMRAAMPKFKINQELIDRMNGVTRELLEGMPVIRTFNTERHEENKFNDVNDKMLRTNLFINRTISLMMPMMMLIMNGASLLIVWVGGHQLSDGVLEIGDMMAFIQYAMQIIMAFLMIAAVAIILPRASVSANRIFAILDTDIRIKDKKECKSFDTDKKGYVDFEHVSFRYPGAQEDVLHDISFTARPKETTAFIGSTGSGKSTIINLVPRFFDVSEGCIRVDGVDIRDVPQKELRDKIGYVPQKGVLFSGTIASNLRYAKEDASDDELKQAADIAQASEFIDAKTDGYETSISQGGTNVSGGQKQRLSIARALVKQPEIYIFDDSFSALDFKTDANLRNALQKLCKQTNATVLLVAQRISSIMHADRIVVLDQGRVAGIGTHEELMKNCKVYQEIAYSQLSKEELGNE